MTSSGDWYRAAVERFQRGEWREAEACCQQLLLECPLHPDGYHLLGLIAFQENRLDEALHAIEKAASLLPHQGIYANSLGNVYNRLGDFAQAECAYRRAVEIAPSLTEAYHGLANTLRSLGRAQEAEDSYRDALQLRPQFVEAWYNRGLNAWEDGKPAQAISSLQQAIAIRPDFSPAYRLLGSIYRAQACWPEAVAAYRRAVQLASADVWAKNDLGNVLQETGDIEEAIEHYQAAIRLAPREAIFHSNLGNAYRRLHSAESLAAYQQAIELAPESSIHWLYLGHAYLLFGKHREAIDAYGHALSLHPQSVDAKYHLGQAYEEIGEWMAARDAFEAVLEQAPDHAAALGSLIFLQQRLCDWERLTARAERLIALLESPAHDTASSPVAPLIYIGLPRVTTARQQQLAARRWNEATIPKVHSPITSTPAVPRRAATKLRIGYVSGDFQEHPVAHLMAPVIERHRRDRFELFGYSYGIDDGGSMRPRLHKAFDHFRDLCHASTTEIVRRIREDQLDILIDLQGHTHRSRLAVLAYRPATIQVTYLGYPGTTGADFIDYILVDEYVVPPDQQSYFQEKLVQIPGCYLVSERCREITALPVSRSRLGLPEEALVLCGFSSPQKLNPPLFDLWLRLIRAIPHSVLWLRDDSPLATAHLRRYAAGEGIEEGRLVFAPKVAVTDHLARQVAADLFLDAFPYNQHSTAADALGMGLPVVTLSGQTFASRVAGSLLRAVGLEALIAHDADDYEAIIRRFAEHPSSLKEVRRQLGDSLGSSPLFDAPSFVERLETVYETIWDDFTRHPL